MQECLGASVPAGGGGKAGWDHAGLSHGPALLLKCDPVCQQAAPGETQVSSEPRRLLSPAGHRPFALDPGVIRTVLWPAFLRDEGSEDCRLV